MKNISTHPTSIAAKNDKAIDRENLARQMRTSQMMREAAREQINATEVITELVAIDLALQGSKDPAGNPIPIEREIIAALRARADIKFKLLGKVLPDLKATESVSHSTHDHAHVHAHTDVSNMELASRLQFWRKQHLADPDAEIETGGLPTTQNKESCADATFTEANEQEFDFI